MSDFTNGEAVMRVYDVLEKLMVMKDLEQRLEKILQKEDLDNSFFFE